MCRLSELQLETEDGLLCSSSWRWGQP